MIETAERLNNQAILLAADGSFTEAIACFARALTIEKNNALLWFNLGITYRDAGKLKQAEEALFKSYQISPEDTDTIEELALVLYNQGKFDQAIEFCLAGLHIMPENSHLWNTHGVVLFNKEMYEEACISFENAVIMNPYYYDALFNLRDTYHKLNNKAGEDECIQRMKALKKSGEPL